MKVEVKIINQDIAGDEPARIGVCLNDELIAETGVEVEEEEEPGLSLCPVITSEKVEIMINGKAVAEIRPEILVLVDGKLISRIIVKIEEQAGDDKVFYSAVVLEEIR